MLHPTYKVTYCVGGFFLILRIMTIFEERMTTRLVMAQEKQAEQLKRIANLLEALVNQTVKNCNENDKK